MLFIVVVLLSVNMYRYKSLRIDAFTCLSIGFVYYWIVPSLAVVGVLDLSDPALAIVRSYIQSVDITRMFYYCVIGLIAYILFFLGTIAIKNDGVALNFHYSQQAHSEKTLKIVWQAFIVITFLLVVICAIPIRDQFFKGYSADLFKGYTDGVMLEAIPRGRFTASTVLLLVATFSYLARYTHTIKSFIFHPYFIMYLGAAVLALSLGGRLYFISSLFSVVVFLSLFRNANISLKKALVLGCCTAVLFITYGAMRAGGSFTVSAAITNFLQEPLLTSLSLYSFLANDNSIVVGNIYLLLIDFLNLVPSAMVPDKLALLVDPRDFGYHYDMPLGGLHLYVSATIKFGVLLMLVGSFFFGALLAWFQNVSYFRKEYSVIYALVCGWLVFSFYRDPFFISLVKNIFEFSIVIPFLLSFIARRNH
ncbi:hypothetical protein PKO51_12410 [Yokenella regensburgei]|jgi:hypothetical protein|uniref:hypothetical protein n=1 Tax=Yokenella regensburgei TaxID=158877 RepID=UPI00207762A7|nr:hypothetical protein [Yokenella regensburgei]MDQ4430167.1 hypothetical protein [Yokenella regensburgei]